VNTVSVLDSHIAYTDAGQGTVPVVFLHGNPASSHTWRAITPYVTDMTRAVAPDLMGMGDSGKPDIGYRFADHADYLEAFLDTLGAEQVVLVGHDWGGALAMDYATRHPGRVVGLVLMETFLRRQSWSELSPKVAEFFGALRTPGVGEQLALESNFFIDQALPSPYSTTTGIAAEDLDVFRAPYPTPESRRPLLQFPREIPFDGEPADVAARFDAYGAWLAESPEIPKLLLTVEEGQGIAAPEVVDWARQTVAALEIQGIGPAGHQATEDQPEAIGQAIAGWLGKQGLVTGTAA
jgi:haloalkane dehalogenase